jgi:cyanate permease
VGYNVTVSRVGPPPFTVAWHWITVLSMLLVFGGGVGVLADAPSWAWVIVGGLGLGSASSIAVAFVAYRRTMSTRWPQVAPLGDDDWDD